MGQYEPNDSRDVTLNKGHEPGGLERTGPREGETRQQEQDGGKNAQPGYGNARDEDGQSEQDMKKGKPQPGEEIVGETSDDPTRRAQADANRPLGDD